MTLTIDMAFFPGSNFNGETPKFPSKNVDASRLLQAIEIAVADATEAGFLNSGGYMTVTIQAARKV